LVFPQIFGSPQNTISMSRLPQRIEWNTGPCEWSLRQKREATDWYLSQLYGNDSDWYLTVVDQIGDCGA